MINETSQVALVVKNPPANAGDRKDMGLILALGRSREEGEGNTLQYSCLGNPMDRGAWWATVHSLASQGSNPGLPHCRQILYQLRGADKREVQEGGNICILMADSCYCLAETNTTL